MSAEHLATAIDEARRFIKKAEALYADTVIARRHSQEVTNGERKYWERKRVSPKDTGAVRRASMDLTRSLADLRRV